MTEELKGLVDLGWFGQDALSELAKIEQEIRDRMDRERENEVPHD